MPPPLHVVPHKTIDHTTNILLEESNIVRDTEAYRIAQKAELARQTHGADR